jgi:hypothetical protein
MKTLLTLVMILAFHLAQAQDDAIAKFFNQYEGDDKFTTVYITSKMFSLIAQIPEGEDEDDFMNIIRRLTGVRILSSDSLPAASGIYQQARNLLVKNGFEDLMVVKDGSEELKFMVRQKGEIISEFVMISGEPHRFSLISLTGDLRLRDISKLSKTMDIKGFDKLDKVNEKQP